MPRFKVGDSVRMVGTSTYYNQCCVGFPRVINRQNPTSGTIREVLELSKQWEDRTGEKYVYAIEWHNGNRNNYRESDVRPLADDDNVMVKAEIMLSLKALNYINDNKKSEESHNDFLERMLGINIKTEIVQPAIRHLDLDD